MSFQIINHLGEPVDIQQLDIEAATFWGKEVNPKEYANPTPPFTNDGLEGHELGIAKAHYQLSKWSNWFDSIGWNIHYPKVEYTHGWANVKCSMTTVQSSDLGTYLMHKERTDQKIEAMRIYLKPYFDLIDHWEAKGYEPVQIKD